jgi:hypothetical protein
MLPIQGGAKTRSIGPSPSSWWASVTSPLRAYLIGGAITRLGACILAYADDSSTAALSAFATLCPLCSLVHHMGLAGQIGRQQGSRRARWCKSDRAVPSTSYALCSSYAHVKTSPSTSRWVRVPPPVAPEHPS